MSELNIAITLQSIIIIIYFIYAFCLDSRFRVYKNNIHGIAIALTCIIAINYILKHGYSHWPLLLAIPLPQLAIHINSYLRKQSNLRK